MSVVRYWLTPIFSDNPLYLSGDRIHCMPLEELEVFRDVLRGVHPWLLPMFKASLLLSDDENVCGSDEIRLDVSVSSELRFDGNPYHLSHCAEAFLDRLLEPSEALLLLIQGIDSSERANWNSVQMDWLQSFRGWLEQGWKVILLREDVE